MSCLVADFHTFFGRYRKRHPRASPQRIAKKYELAFGVTFYPPKGRLVADKIVYHFYSLVAETLGGLWDPQKNKSEPAAGEFHDAFPEMNEETFAYNAPLEIAHAATRDLVGSLRKFVGDRKADEPVVTEDMVLDEMIRKIPQKFKDRTNLMAKIERVLRNEKGPVKKWLRALTTSVAAARRKQFPTANPPLMVNFHVTGRTMTYVIVQETYEYLMRHRDRGNLYTNSVYSLLDLLNHEHVMGPAYAYLMNFENTTYMIMGERHTSHACIARDPRAMTAYKLFVDLSNALPHVLFDIFLENGPIAMEARTPRVRIDNDFNDCFFLANDIFTYGVLSTHQVPESIQRKYGSIPEFQKILVTPPGPLKLHAIRAFLQTLTGSSREEFNPLSVAANLLSVSKNYFFSLIPSDSAWRSDRLPNVRVHVADLRNNERTPEFDEEMKHTGDLMHRALGLDMTDWRSGGSILFSEPRMLRQTESKMKMIHVNFLTSKIRFVDTEATPPAVTDVDMERVFNKGIQKLISERGPQFVRRVHEIFQRLSDSLRDEIRRLVLQENPMAALRLTPEEMDIEAAADLNFEYSVMLTDYYTVLRMIRPSLRGGPETKRCVCFYGGDLHARHIAHVLLNLGAEFQPLPGSRTAGELSGPIDYGFTRSQYASTDTARHRMLLQPILRELGVARGGSSVAHPLADERDLPFAFQDEDVEMVEIIRNYYGVVDEIKSSVINNARDATECMRHVERCLGLLEGLREIILRTVPRENVTRALLIAKALVGQFDIVTRLLSTELSTDPDIHQATERTMYTFTTRLAKLALDLRQ